MKVGERVKDKYTGEVGIILDIWDGNYTVDCYKGRQYNPYRVTVKFGKSPATMHKLEHLVPE